MSDINTIIKVSKNFSATKGDSFGIVVLKFFTKTPTGEKIPVPLAGNVFTLKAYNNSGVEVLSFTMENGFEIQGVNELVMTKSAELMDIPEGSYPYKFKRTYSGLTKTISVGFFLIKA